MKHESHFTSGMVAHLREKLGGSVVFKHSDQLTAGVPDTSVTWRRSTTWLEVKIKRSGAITTDSLQDTNMRRLAAAGKNAFYVIFGEGSTEIVHPRDDSPMVQSGIYQDYRLVEMFIRRMHGDTTS